MKYSASNMTEGGIAIRLLKFSIPLLLGNLLQQLYNAFDAVVVGNYVSNEALAAVGASAPLINMLIAFFMGMSQGASVLISQAYGAQDTRKLHGVVHSSIPLALIIGVVFSVIGVLIAPDVLLWMRTPLDILPDAVTYFRIYFAGMVGLTIYNIGASILTAVGDSRKPLFYLAISAVLNIVLDLLFVLSFGMGIEGVAYATIIAQAITAILVIITLCRTFGPHRLSLRSIRLDPTCTGQIIRLGLPGAIQSSIISASNIMVQSYFNRLGSVAVAGYAAATRIDAFIQLPMMTMTLSTATFVAQNLGARQVRRARDGVKIAVLASAALTVVISISAYIFGGTVMRVFTQDLNVIGFGVRFIRIFALGYFGICTAQCVSGALRGAGDVKFSMFTCIGSWVVLRQIYLFIIDSVLAGTVTYTVETVALCYPITWVIAGAILTVYYFRTNWEHFEKEQETE